ncbi:MAG: class I SAM-dependent methyltransferase [Flavobacteriaceae bacterium]
MNKALLRPEVQKFISEFTGSVTKLALKGSPWKEISVQELLQQIEGQQKGKEKLPTWFSTKNIYYPPKVNIEQTSSEIAAQYKATLVLGKSLADITGGFGVDTYFLSEKFNVVHHFEQNSSLSAIAKHNFEQLGKGNVSFFSEDGIHGIQNQQYDVIYVDPSRRHATKGKVYFLNDCEPNLVEYQEYLLAHCDMLLVKTAPMLDVSVGLRELSHVSEIHIVAVQNEVKELLWILSKNTVEAIQIRTINFLKETTETFNFYWKKNTCCTFSKPLSYLFEPNAAIMKSGGFAALSEAFNLPKLAEHSHLFTNNSYIEFPGRVFKILDVLPYSKSEMKPFLKRKANISIRNFPETVAQLRKKWKILEGGETYLFFTTLENKEKVVLKCEKV